MTGSAVAFHFVPLLPALWLYVLGGLAGALLALSALFYRSGLALRAACAAAFLFVLSGPSVIHEKRESAADVVAIVVDRSPSQQAGERTSRTDNALRALRESLSRYGSQIETRIIEAPAAAEGPARETRLFGPLEDAMADVPGSRRAGAIFLTDGQVHDVPPGSRLGEYGPLHVLLTGDRNEKDRQLVVLEAPAYGIVGQDAVIRYRIEDAGTGESEATVIVRQDGQPPRASLVPVNENQTVTVTVGHAGQNVVDIEAAPLDGEITQENNRVPLVVNGVRDRLRVLLVSGQPHAGGRTWRDILTSDPGVDLVHFTILREPEKLDATPQNELSLIAFPFHELFEVKLYDFDLIIFDRYRLNRILPNYYFANIARYVQEGGALLEASGPAFAGQDSIYATALKDVLPGAPTGRLLQERFRPDLTAAGHRHPVTQTLSWPGGEWGRWLRQVDVAPAQGDVLMTGAQGKPLLILNRIGKGRVAQLASDQIWLWARGYDGGGPQADLLRHLAHWLMKEPELEEDALDARIDESSLAISRRTLTEDPVTVTVKMPGGSEKSVKLTPAGSEGLVEARLPVEGLGIYTVSDGVHTRYAVAGDINPPELRGVKTTDSILARAADLSGGSIQWLADGPGAAPSPRLQPAARHYGGRGWMGLRKNGSYTLTGVKDAPFLPSWIYALFLLGLTIGCWWIEGRSSAGRKGGAAA